jgi:DNA-binding protein H-NS
MAIKGMNVEALMSLRDQIDKRLRERRVELEKELTVLTKGRSIRIGSLKGRKVPPKYRSPSGETWAGRGARPRWLVAALKKGKKVEHFLITRRRAKR